ncbi:MAG: exosortase C-terminal domain/associated protein EpsI [Armatimonadota bacterium]
MSKANYLLICLLIGAAAVVQSHSGSDHRASSRRVELSGVPTSFMGWSSRELNLGPDSMKLLEPDAVLWRLYTDPTGLPLEFLVVFGHQKKTFHSPGFCLPGGGWEVTAKRSAVLHIDSIPVHAAVLQLQRDRHRQLAIYWFVHRKSTTPSVVRHNVNMLLSRIAHREAGGALVRVLLPITSTEEEAIQRATAFLSKIYPEVVSRIQA